MTFEPVRIRGTRVSASNPRALATYPSHATGHPPLMMDLRSSEEDDDHNVALFRQNACWGCISVTNHSSLR